jgi:hypothetical protein
VDTVFTRKSPTGGTFRSLLRVVHEDQKGGVSIETVLIIAAIALPILIFLVKFAWPKIREYFEDRTDEIFQEGEQAGGA